jgi:hypothetical protein
MNLPNLDDKVTAAAIAAAGTVIGTLIQLKFAWRKEVSERARGVPATKKSRRGPVLAVGLLLVGAVVGGFAFSQYLVRQQSDLESAARHSELQTQLAQISATAARLERASQTDHGSSARSADDRRGAEGVAVTTTVGPCRARAVGPDAAPACDEKEALRVTLCASVPSSAVVTAMTLFARPEDSLNPWTESRVPGQDLGRARFADKTFERAESDQTKQVCTDFSSWDGERGYSARLVVKYVMAPAPSEASNAQLVPTGMTQ